MQVQGEIGHESIFLSAKQTIVLGTITDKEEGMGHLKKSLKASLTKVE